MADFAQKSLLWQRAKLNETFLTSKNVKVFRFEPEFWFPHIPGQHFDIRVQTSSGSYEKRDFSAANSPSEKGVWEFGIELIENGAVSPILWKLKVGDSVEIKGPSGGYYAWNEKVLGTPCLIGGGSGVTPLVSILRHFDFLNDRMQKPIALLMSASTKERAPYLKEIEEISRKNRRVGFLLTLTKEKNKEVSFNRRIDASMIKDVFGKYFLEDPIFYVSGSRDFVSSVKDCLELLGFGGDKIKTEVFR